MLLNGQEYLDVVGMIKKEIYVARHKAVFGANKELICLYWNIGKIINENSTWGNKFIENLAIDIKLDFPKVTGYSARNLKYMAKFQRVYSHFEIVQTVFAQLSWSHNLLILDKLRDDEMKLWYAKKCIEHGWSLNVFRHQIELNLFERQAGTQKISNFTKKLSDTQSELALEIMKDPYVFDFIEARENIIEREIESELIANIAKTLLEFGTVEFLSICD